MKWSILSYLWKLFAGSRPKITEITQVYLKHIAFQERQLEEQKKIIADYKKLHPENGVELDEWLSRENELHQQIINLIYENRVLKEQVIFIEAELSRYKKKHRSMYE